MISTEVGQFEGRWRLQPTWWAYSPNFAHVGRKCGYTRWQAEMRLTVAIVTTVMLEDRRFWRRKTA